MASGQVRRFAFLIGLAAMATAAGCFLSEETDESSDGRAVAGKDVSGILKSTLILDSGCVATKVGPRHLLTAARCVAGKPEFEAGRTIEYRVASPTNTIVAQDANAGNADAGDAGNADAGDAGDSPSDAGVGNDGRANDSADKTRRKARIADVRIHASYSAKCKDDACGFDTLEASDAKDIAVIILSADLLTIPTVPVDLDTVGQSDSVIAIGSGCDTFDGTPTTVRTVETIAVPAKSVNHAGSPYIEKPELVTRLGSRYVVTPGSGWRSKEAHLCKSDIGAPLFRGARAAVAGVTSNFTTFGHDKMVPVTVHHTRVDTASKIGPWLATLGVETIHSCSETKPGCLKREYDGGAPDPRMLDGTTHPGDGVGDASAPTEKDASKDDSHVGDPGSTDQPSKGGDSGSEGNDYSGDDDDDYGQGYDAGPYKKKKKKELDGCSAAPGSAPPSGLALGLGIALAAATVRRRRR